MEDRALCSTGPFQNIPLLTHQDPPPLPPNSSCKTLLANRTGLSLFDILPSPNYRPTFFVLEQLFFGVSSLLSLLSFSHSLPLSVCQSGSRGR